MTRSAALALVLFLGAAAGAYGGDDQPKAGATADAPDGHKATVKLKNGRSMSGVLFVDGVWERHDEKTGWAACGKDDAGASVRLWYVNGSDGSLVLAAKAVESVEVGATLGAADLKKMAADSEAAGKRADAERDELRKKRAAAREATRIAEEKAAAIAKANSPEEVARRAELAAADKHAAELLAKFPPPDWGPERRDEINRRALIMKLMPTTDERQFLDEYATWAKAAAAAAAKATADKKDAERREAEKKEAEKKDDGKKPATPPDMKKPDAKKPDAK